MFVEYDDNAFRYPQTIGKTADSISGLGPADETMLKTIFIMPNKSTNPDATLMIVVDEKEPNTDPKTYQYVYVGNINDLPSDVLTEESIVNNLITGGTDKPLSAEQGRTLNSHVNYTTCGSNAEDQVKLISDDGFELSTHLRLLVLMANTNTDSTPKFNINNTGIKDVWYNGSVASDINTWSAGEVLDVYYDGINYVATTHGGSKFSTGEKIGDVGIDAEPTAGSNSLVKSGGVYEEIGQLDQKINGGYEYQDISPTLTDNKVYNTNQSSIFVRYPSTNLDGSKCCNITVTSGEKYRIYGLGGNQYALLYTITGPMNGGSGEATAIVKSASDLNSRTNGVEITIPEGGALLLVNFYQYNSSTDKIQKYSAVPGIVDDISNLENRVVTLDDDINGEGGVIDKINVLELDIIGSDEEIVTENITTTSTSWTDYNLSKNIPTGSVIYSRSIPGAAYLIDTNGNMDESARLDSISLPYTTTKEYKAFTTRTVGNFSFTYRFGSYSAGLEDISTLKGKTIVCFGDSLTENSGNNGKRYSDIIAELSQANVINVGIGGARFQQRRAPVLDLSTVSDDNERWQTAFAMFDIVNVVRSACNLTDGNGNYYRTYMDNAEQYLENPTSGDAVNLSAFKARLYAIDWSKVDVVTVFGGTNDWNNASEYLGESGSTNPSRTLGAINTIIQSILTTYPHITLYWFTPIVRWINYSGGTGIASNFSDNLTRSDMTLKQYSAILQNEVVNNHVPCCDMYNTLGWNMYNFSTYFPNNDGTHPKRGRGFECIAKKIFYFILTNRTF